MKKFYHVVHDIGEKENWMVSDVPLIYCENPKEAIEIAKRLLNYDPNDEENFDFNEEDANGIDIKGERIEEWFVIELPLHTKKSTTIKLNIEMNLELIFSPRIKSFIFFKLIIPKIINFSKPVKAIQY